MRPLLDVAGIASQLGVSKRWIRYEMKRGELPYLRVGSKQRVVRFDLDEVMAWIKNREAPQTIESDG
jgi:excisionase family DNA binding protein